MDLSVRIGTEKLQREALLLLYSNLNTKIASMQATWTAEDDQYWAALGRGNPDWSVEPISNSNFYSGTVPSLINAPVDKYPNVCVIAYIARPKRSSDDVGENYTVTLAVEVMVRSFESEEEVNARIQKTLDACHMVIMENRTINNTVAEVLAPIMTIGDVFIRRAEQGHGDRWFWQGGRLEYPVDKYVAI